MKIPLKGLLKSEKEVGLKSEIGLLIICFLLICICRYSTGCSTPTDIEKANYVQTYEMMLNE